MFVEMFDTRGRRIKLYRGTGPLGPPYEKRGMRSHRKLFVSQIGFGETNGDNENADGMVVFRERWLLGTEPNPVYREYQSYFVHKKDVGKIRFLGYWQSKYK